MGEVEVKNDGSFGSAKCGAPPILECEYKERGYCRLNRDCRSRVPRLDTEMTRVGPDRYGQWYSVPNERKRD